jgi:hypothetical protein
MTTKEEKTATKDNEPRPTGPNFPVMVLRIKAKEVDYLFFGPVLPHAAEVTEIEVMGLTSRDSLIEALKKGSEEMEDGVVVQ